MIIENSQLTISSFNIKMWENKLLNRYKKCKIHQSFIVLIVEK